jgi:hypothetical protein
VDRDHVVRCFTTVAGSRFLVPGPSCCDIPDIWRAS